MDPAPRLLLTPGDPSGIGPEVVLKAVAVLRKRGGPPITLVGPVRLWEAAADRLGLVPPEELEVELVEPEPVVREQRLPELLFAGRSLPDGARLALRCLERAADLLETAPSRAAVVTGPVSKRGLHDTGLDVPGQTEWFARRFGVSTPVMMLVGGRLRVALLTTHLPLSRVAAALDPEGIVIRLRVLAGDLVERFGIDAPKMALLALNPHGGLDGERGEEERNLLEPALGTAREQGLDVAGPFSADAFFGRRQWEEFDAVVAPYHDQGLIPVKMEAAGAGVNVTLGLPVIRTSPDHGTAFDIAGSGTASEAATVAAARLAVRLLQGEEAV
jgi:4-hydroxythreonine-4-phosphate dehydrogenase